MLYDAWCVLAAPYADDGDAKMTRGVGGTPQQLLVHIHTYLHDIYIYVYACVCVIEVCCRIVFPTPLGSDFETPLTVAFSAPGISHAARVLFGQLSQELQRKLEDDRLRTLTVAGRRSS